MEAQQIRVWDLPVRLFHWSLVLLFALAWLTGDILEIYEPHEIIGLGILALVSFRIVWGFVGSTTARFSQFVRGKSAVVAYLNGDWQGTGHNPLGGWSVLLMFAFLLAMVGTGLFANDDADFTGPLSFLVDNALSSNLTRVHHWLFDGLLIVVAVHVGAILFYKIVLAKDLVRPMLTGQKEAESEQDVSTQGGGVIAIIIAVTMAALVVWGASGAWYQPPAKPAISTPDW
jgi:cytochrome b